MNCTPNVKSKEGVSPLRRLVACGGLEPSPVVVTINQKQATSQRQNIMSALLGNCGMMCASFPEPKESNLTMSTQFIQLHGLRFIGLGAVVDELTPKERVYDTLEQLTTRTERMISIGYLIDIPSIMAENRYLQSGPFKVTETLPLDVWKMNYPNKDSMSVQVAEIVKNTKVRHAQ
jgi:hypothetical protein